MSINAYNKNLVKQSDPEQLFIRSFDTIAKKIEIAQSAMAQNNINTTHIELCKAHEILKAMIFSITYAVEKEDPFCIQLNEYLQIVYRQLMIFEGKKDTDMGARTLTSLRELSSVWREEKSAKAAANPPPTIALTEEKFDAALGHQVSRLQASF